MQDKTVRTVETTAQSTKAEPDLCSVSVSPIRIGTIHRIAPTSVVVAIYCRYRLFWDCSLWVAGLPVIRHSTLSRSSAIDSPHCTPRCSYTFPCTVFVKQAIVHGPRSKWSKSIHIFVVFESYYYWSSLLSGNIWVFGYDYEARNLGRLCQRAKSLQTFKNHLRSANVVDHLKYSFYLKKDAFLNGILILETNRTKQKRLKVCKTSIFYVFILVYIYLYSNNKGRQSKNCDVFILMDEVTW